MRIYKTRDPFEIARLKHILIIFEDLGTINGYYKKAYRQKQIHINQNLPRHRQRFVCAHELGHAILHPNSNTPFLRGNTFFLVDKLEIEANSFALELLISDEELIQYYALPDGQRAELIDSQLYMMAQPNRRHQKILQSLSWCIESYIRLQNGSCEVYPAPFAVFLTSDDKTYVEPDISVICDRNKLDDRGCKGAPDWIIEIVSPSSRRMDYSIKNTLYSESGVREYWIVDPKKERVTVYHYEEDDAPKDIRDIAPHTSLLYAISL